MTASGFNQTHLGQYQPQNIEEGSQSHGSNRSHEQQQKQIPSSEAQQQHQGKGKDGAGVHDDVAEIKNYIKEQEEFLKKLENDKLKAKERIDNLKNAETLSTNVTPRKKDTRTPTQSDLGVAESQRRKGWTSDFNANDQLNEGGDGQQTISSYVPKYEARSKPKQPEKVPNNATASSNISKKEEVKEQHSKKRFVQDGNSNTEDNEIPEEGIVQNETNLKRDSPTKKLQKKNSFQVQQEVRVDNVQQQDFLVSVPNNNYNARVSKWSKKGSAEEAQNMKKHQQVNEGGREKERRKEI